MITISPGHYGPRTGASSIIDEVTEAIKVSKRVSDIIKSKGIKVNYVEDNVSKVQSKNIAWLISSHNKTERKLDVSIHFNKVGERTKRSIGTEVLYYSDSSKSNAQSIVNAISKASGLINRGVKKRTDLGLLKGTNKPCLLIEVCFVESEPDVKSYQSNFESICTAIANELIKIVGGEVSKVTTENTKRAYSVIEKAVKEKTFNSEHKEKETYSTDKLLGLMVDYIERKVK